MINKLLSIAIITIVVLVSACANSGDKWSKDTVRNSDNKETDWQQNQQSKSVEKETSSSYWKDDNRY